MEEEIKLILEEIIGNPEISKKINSNTDIASDIGLDSLAMISFILKIEERLNICIDFESFSYDHLGSIKKFANFLENCKKLT